MGKNCRSCGALLDTKKRRETCDDCTKCAMCGNVINSSIEHPPGFCTKECLTRSRLKIAKEKEKEKEALKELEEKQKKRILTEYEGYKEDPTQRGERLSAYSRWK